MNSMLDSIPFPCCDPMSSRVLYRFAYVPDWKMSQPPKDRGWGAYSGRLEAGREPQPDVFANHQQKTFRSKQANPPTRASLALTGKQPASIYEGGVPYCTDFNKQVRVPRSRVEVIHPVPVLVALSNQADPLFARHLTCTLQTTTNIYVFLIFQSTSCSFSFLQLCACQASSNVSSMSFPPPGAQQPGYFPRECLPVLQDSAC
jgi:hypothetical protein